MAIYDHRRPLDGPNASDVLHQCFPELEPLVGTVKYILPYGHETEILNIHRDSNTGTKIVVIIYL